MGGVYLRCVHLGIAFQDLDDLPVTIKLIHRRMKQFDWLIILNHWFVVLRPAFGLRQGFHDHALTGFSYCTPCRTGGFTNIRDNRDSRYRVQSIK